MVKYLTQTRVIRRVVYFYQVLVLDSGVIAFEDIRELEINDEKGAEAV